ncbi:protocadherin-16 [Mauremys reevesii]|uniref:protocadherin-16 n=1 Tax=Mauremys reevesii TaxID=260615 RepID=UPI00193F35D5|nr:protocadherin-16 [Mauremys reevesii]XP_039353247.1 protocadherin-16 [Mauremys reevesii]XP_039353255.1 protocadherin-16 [Mauremys reevesii]
MGCLKRSTQLLLQLLLLGGLKPGQGSTVLGTLDLQIDEEQPAGTIIGDISAGLPPSTTAYMYFISAQEGSGVTTDLEIDENTGIIKTARVLDRERRDRYSFIAVTPEGITVEVNVQVNDINDHAPEFPKHHHTFQIPEHTHIGSRFPLDPAFDADSGLLNTQGYVLKGENVGQAFRLETRRGPNGVLYLDLVVSNVLDRENCSSYSLLLEAYDGGSPPRSTQMTLDVAIQDINDNAPAFNQSRYHTLISENLKPGSSILQVFASDADEGDNGAVVYEINRRQSDPDQYFTIDSRTGVIKLNKGLDYEMRKVHELVVQARDKAMHPEVTTAFVTIHVRDYNDNQPTMTIIFLSEDGSPQISEGAQPGQYVARISVSDPDYGEYSNVNVSLEGGDGKFALTTKDNIIYLICVDQLLDREERDSYDLRVTATDSGTPPLRAESAFVLQVMDVNDNPPLFDQQEYKQSIPEVVYPGSFVLQVTARDKDQGPNGEVRYSILHSQDTHSNWFTIDPATGIITTAASLDYEKDPQPQLTVLAMDRGTPVLSSTAVVHVALQDINDNEPVFRSNFYNVSLKENTPAGTCFLQITATDADSGPFGSLSYSIGSGIGSVVPTQFSINEHTGQLCTVQGLDRDEGATAYDFTVTAVDGGGLNSMVYVKVFLEDVNDNRPAFYPLEYAASISTQSMPGTAVLRVMAHDKDEGPHGKVTYHIVSGNSPPLFSLHKDTGVVSLSWSLSGKANTLVQLVISARDGGGLSAQPNAQVNISIVAGTVSPPVFEQAQYFFTVPEDTQQGASVGAVRAHNPPGHSDDIFYSISSGDPHGYFFIDSSLGQLRTNLPLDHEVQAVLVLDVQARSGSPPAYSNTQVKISVSDVNDNAPAFLAPSDSILLPEATEVGATVYTLQAEDRDSGANGQVHFELVSGGDGIFSVERSSGTVRVVGALQYEASAAYGLTIVARDSGVPQLSATFTLLVHVQAEHDHGPIFDTLTYRVEVREGTPVSTRFLQVRALGRDSGATLLTYHLRADGDAASFGIMPESGWLYVKSALDRETRDLYMLTVLASAGAGGTSSEARKTGTSTVRVSITDENDNSPRLSEERYFFTIPENQPPGSRVGRVTASDRDTGQNSRLTYRLLQHDPNFLIHMQSGELTAKRSLDREQQSSYQLLVIVQDGGTPPRSVTGTVYVTVLDENDNLPAFLHVLGGRELLVQVLEEKPSGLLVASLQAKDPDEGENGTIVYSLAGAWAERFTLHTATGELRTATVLRRTDRAEYIFTVTASDRAMEPRSTAATVRIQVLPSSRVLPQPDATVVTLHLVEGVRPGSVIGSVAPPEASAQGHLTYTLLGGGGDGTFVVDSVTGEIYVARELDYEVGAQHTLHVSAEDTQHGYLASRLVLVQIQVQDCNDQAPAFPEDPITIVVPENTQAGTSIFTFQAVDGDGAGPNSQVCYRLLRQEPPGSHFQLDAHSGLLSLQQGLDREAAPSFLLVVEATDQARNVSQRRSAAVTARVFVTDENDNAPIFLSPATVSIMEDQPTGFMVLHIVARDGDLGENGRVSYTLQAGNAEGRFHLNPSTGALSIVRALNREEVSQHNLTVVAMDHGFPRRSSMQLLTVLVLDVNDEAPAFERAEYEASVMENLPAGSPVLQLLATDCDLGANGHVSYGGLSGGPFSIHPQTGLVTTMHSLDRERREQHVLTVYARDGGLPSNLAKVTVRILVGDENDHAPRFESKSCSLEVPENQSRVALYTLRATDLDAGENGRLEYHVMDGDPAQDFILDPASGVFSTSRSLDRELVASYRLTVVARDHGTPQRSATMSLSVRVLDLNDNAPRFAQAAYTVEVPEDLPVGALVLQLVALDPDEGTNGQVSYYLGNESLGMFQVEPQSGRITSAQALDRERRPTYSFLAKAVDSAPWEPKSAAVRVTVTVRDVNDHAPAFLHSPLSVNLSRHTPPKQVVATMRAEDKDAGANASILYRFATPNPSFAINSYTGAIQLLQPLGSLSQRQRTLFILATDLGQPALSSTGVVVIYLQEESYRGVRFPRSTRDVAIPENAVTGTTVVSIQATHAGGSSGRITYSIVSGNEKNAFLIQPSSGAISVQDSSSLDFESSPRLRLVVQAETATSFGFMAVNLNLQDVNDNLPRFQLQNYVAFIWESQSYDSPVIQVLADDPDQGANGQVTYAINQSLPMSGLYHIDAQIGTITTAAILDREIWSQTRLVVTAMDRGNPPLIGSATLTVVVMDVNDNSPTIPPPWEVRVPENTLLGTEITQVTGNDVDSGPALSYTLVPDGGAAGTFSILRYGGRIALTAPLDYEQCSHYVLTIRSSDSRHETEANLTVIVEDINDNAPTFSQGLYQVTLLEHTPAGSTILTVSATDRDSGSNGELTYRLAVPSSDVSINPSNGTLFTSRRVELDANQPTLDLVVEVRDHGSPSLSAWTTVQIQVLDVNDHSPTFQQAHYNTCVPEDLRPGTTVLTLEAGDADLSRENAGFDYTIVSGNSGNAFQVESHMGWSRGHLRTQGALVLVEALDFEAVPIYNLTVAASDRGVPQRSTTVPVLVTVLDVNDNLPVFARAEYHTAVSESTPPGTELLRLAAHDADSGPYGQVHYSISSGDQRRLFQLHEATGALRLAQSLDRETQALHSLVVQASDGPGGHFALVPITIEVKDINDNIPYFPVETLSASVRENLPPGTLVTTLHAIDADTGAFGEVRYTVLEQAVGEVGAPEGRDVFFINRTSGELRSRLAFDYERAKAFQLLVQATDAGNASATVTVRVLVTGEDEYSPVFLSPDFSFQVPEGAHKGQSIGRVLATDEDEGVDGVVLYSLTKPSPYFGVNQTTGTIYLRMDSQPQPAGRAKREPREMNLEVQARSPLPSSRSASAQVSIDVTHTSFGLVPDLNLLLVVAVAASLGVVVVLAAVAIILVLVRSRHQQGHKKPEQDSQLNRMQSGSLQKLGHEEPVLPGSDRIYHQALPGYGSESAGPYPRGGSLDPSHSSGRGSAEAAEDDEIRMINEYPRVASITSSMQEHISARGPDSGIQQDADQLSDISCEPTTLESAQWFKSKKGSSLLLPGQPPHLYREDGGSSTFLGVGCGLSVSSHPKDYTFPEDGKPSVEGSLTAVVASEEELRGSYNWDYLLNWCPQFQPLASVFTEIARLKDESSLRKPFQAKPKAEPKPRIDPPPLITSVAHPGAKSVPPKPAVGRTFPHLSSLRRSPISHEGSISSSAMSPSFSPSLSPLAARSPVVSPFGVSQGPSASAISAEHSLELPEEAELRI